MCKNGLVICHFTIDRNPRSFEIIYPFSMGRGRCLFQHARLTSLSQFTNTLNSLIILPEIRRNATGDLRHLQRMGQPSAGSVAVMRTHDLGLVGEPSQSSRMEDTRPVTRKRRPMRLHDLGPRQQRLLRTLMQDAVEIGSGISVSGGHAPIMPPKSRHRS